MKRNESNPYDKEYYIGGKKSNYMNYLDQEKMFDKYWMPYISRYAKLSRDKNHLDIGCAYGVLVSKMKKLGWESRGIDVSEFAISQGKGIFGNINICTGSADALPCDNDSQGYITCIDVIEHLNRQQLGKSISEIYRSLKSGGICFTATPNVIDNSLVDIFSEKYMEKDNTHINYQSSYDLYHLFYNAGFSKVFVKGSSPFIPQITELPGKTKVSKYLINLMLSYVVRIFLRNSLSHSSYLFAISVK